METVAVVGLGLIGGSFALGLREAGFRGRILGVSAAPRAAAALQRGLVDEVLPLEEAVGAAGLVYLSNRISRILEALPQVAAAARPGTLVTDAGSTKAAIVARAREVFGPGGAIFLGGHPMAGKAERGVEAAEAGLFRGATYILTPEDGVLPEAPAVREFCAWLGRLGARLLVLDPEAHDAAVAFTSHLPQLASTALAAVVGEHTTPRDRRTAGGGLRDMTRLARSAYDLWRDICLTNTGNLDRALSVYIQKLEHLRQNLRERELQREFARAKELADEVRPPADASALEPR